MKHLYIYFLNHANTLTTHTTYNTHIILHIHTYHILACNINTYLNNVIYIHITTYSHGTCILYTANLYHICTSYTITYNLHNTSSLHTCIFLLKSIYYIYIHPTIYTQHTYIHTYMSNLQYMLHL